jgi:hypothetical protein
MKTKAILLAAAFVGSMLVGSAQAAVLHSFSTANANLTPDDGYDPAVVNIVADANVTAPASGAALAAGNTGLARFWNTEWAGFSLTSANALTIDDATEFATGYLTWTVAANPGYELNLTSLTFPSAQGGTTGSRGYALYAEVNGGTFDFSDTPVASLVAETGTRAAPTPTTVDLSAVGYQGIDSITFRYYPLTPAPGNTVDFGNMTLNGDAVLVPEPASLGLIALGGLTLLRRRR